MYQFIKPFLDNNMSIFEEYEAIYISCKLSPVEKICMKFQIPFSGKNKKYITSLSTAELVQRVVKCKTCLERQIQIHVAKF